MAYDSGTSSGYISGVATGSSTDTSWSGHSFSGRSFQQSNLAAQTAPPDAPISLLRLGGAAFLIWIVGFFVIRFVGDVVFAPLKVLAVLAGALWVFLSPVAIVVLAYRWRSSKSAAYKREINDWHQRWICMRCGTSFNE